MNSSQMALDALRLQLEEKHKQDLEQLRCNMALSYREELLQARSELTDRYYSDMEQLKTKHALEIEQLRAKLSDSHLKGDQIQSDFEIWLFFFVFFNSCFVLAFLFRFQR